MNIRYLILIQFLLFYSYVFPNSWHDISDSSVTENLLAVRFINPDTGFVAGWGSERGIIMRTKDGGGTWEKFGMPGYYFFDIYASSVDNFTVAGFTTSGSCGIILKTTNGGKDWKPTLFDDVSAPYTFGIMKYYTKEDTVIYCGGYYSSIIRSTDAGKTWERCKVPLQNEIFRYFDFPVYRNGFAASGLTYDNVDIIYKTNDWGDDWLILNNFRGKAVFIKNIYFPDENNGYIAGSNNGHEAILKTNDGGVTWNEIFAGDNVNRINAISFYGNSEIVAVGDEGKIIKSDDNGLSWNVISNGTGTQYNNCQVFYKDSLPYFYSVGQGIIEKFDMVTGISFSDEGTEIKIFPNPCSEKLYLSTTTENIALSGNYEILNMLGESVTGKNSIVPGLSTISVSDLMPGMYLLILNSNSGHPQRLKFIKK